MAPLPTPLDAPSASEVWARPAPTTADLMRDLDEAWRSFPAFDVDAFMYELRGGALFYIGAVS